MMERAVDLARTHETTVQDGAYAALAESPGAVLSRAMHGWCGTWTRRRNPVFTRSSASGRARAAVGEGMIGTKAGPTVETVVLLRFGLWACGMYSNGQEARKRVPPNRIPLGVL